MTLTTGLLLLLPVGFFALGVSGRWHGFVALATLLLFLYSLVWLFFRPIRFEADDQTLRLVWMFSNKEVPRSDIASVRRVTGRELYTTVGWSVRLGAGGLGGGFGRLWTSKAGLVELWVSRLSGWVLIERHSGKPILLSPSSPDEFVRALTDV